MSIVDKANEARKLIVHVVALLAMVAATGLLKGNERIVVDSILGIASAYGLYTVPNDPPKAP